MDKAVLAGKVDEVSQAPRNSIQSMLHENSRIGRQIPADSESVEAEEPEKFHRRVPPCGYGSWFFLQQTWCVLRMRPIRDTLTGY